MIYAKESENNGKGSKVDLQLAVLCEPGGSQEWKIFCEPIFLGAGRTQGGRGGVNASALCDPRGEGAIPSLLESIGGEKGRDRSRRRDRGYGVGFVRSNSSKGGGSACESRGKKERPLAAIDLEPGAIFANIRGGCDGSARLT